MRWMPRFDATILLLSLLVAELLGFDMNFARP